MTAQISDDFLFDNIEYAVAGVSGQGLFEPADYGFTPIGKDTGCWRGHVCTYALHEGQLVLQRLLINHGCWEGEFHKPLPAPDFEGRRPVAQEEPQPRFGLRYENIGLRVAFTGGLLIATGFLPELYVHMGFHPAWKFRTVHELVFADGRLASRQDVSDRLDAYRKQFTNRNAPPGEDEADRINTWIEETFSLNYGG